MAARPKDKKKLDARFRHRIPQVWTAVRVELAHQVDTGDDFDRPMLVGAKVTADALRPVLTALGSLYDAVPWAAMPPWDLDFVLSAPAQGLPDVSVVVHSYEAISVARSVAARDGTLTWARRKRPRGAWWLDVVYGDASEYAALTAEAVSSGWLTLRGEDVVVALTAMDVGEHPRPLVPADLDLAALVTRALAAWYGEERPVDPWDPAPATVAAGPDVTLTLRGTRLSPLTADDLDDWLDLWGPELTDFGESFPPHEELLALLRDAGERCPPDVEARVLAAGADAVPALCEELVLALDDEDAASVEWYARWILLALARIGDPRALPYVIEAAVLEDEAVGDFVAEDAAAAFAGFGPAAVGPLTELLASPCLDPFLRAAVGSALYLIGVDHPGTRPAVRHVFAAFYDVSEEDFDPAGTVAALLAEKAARTGDDGLYAKVVAALEAEAVDPMFVSRANLDAARAAHPWTRGDHPDMAPVAEKLRRPEWCA